MKEPGFFGDSLPEGVPAELTVSELEEMACRQQQQIESQRQLLMTKEQRLRFLKQHEVKHQMVASEHERLRRLRDKVETQEQKLRKLRALRGQVDQTKLNNVSLTSDLESIRSLFNEKEKELSIAVAKVEELTRQLEELQRGRDINSSQKAPSAAAVELEKLRAELMYRNKLNEQHSARLTHQRELLAQKQEEMAAIDRRIGELQERLHRKRLLNQQLAHQINKQQSQDNNNSKVQMQQQHYPQTVNQQCQMMPQPKPSQPASQLQQKQHQQKLQQMLQLQRHQQFQHQQQQQQLQQQQQQLHHHQLQHQMQHQIQNPQHHENVANKNMQMKNSASQGISLIPKPKSLNKMTTGTNIAAVEPYHHVPLAKSCHNAYAGQQIQQELKPPHRMVGPLNGVMSASVIGSNNMVQQQQRVDLSYSQRNHYPYPLMQQNQKDPRTFSMEDHRIPVFGSPSNDDDKKTNNESASSESKPEDRLHEFWPNKFDPKYQTLPSGTKFSPVSNNVSRYDCRRPGEGLETKFSGNHDTVGGQQKLNTSDKRLADDSSGSVSNNSNNFDGVDTNNGSANNSTCSSSSNAENVRSPNGGSTNQQQQTFMQQLNIVRSMPIPNNSNKGLATALSNSNQSSKNADTAGRHYEVPPFSSHNHVENQSNIPIPLITTSSTNVTFSNTYQKPVSSVSPIYQTSSTRIQPVQPQIIGSISVGQNLQNQQHQYHDSRRTYQANSDPSTNNAYQTMKCNGSIANSNHISKPALPPKPAAPVKITPPPPPRQSAFHIQFAAQSENKCPSETRPVSCDYERENVDENLNHEVESRLTGLDLKDDNKNEKKFYGKDTTDADMTGTKSSTMRGMINMNIRNGLVFNKDLLPKMVAESPPPLPSVDPPSDDEIEKSMKVKTIYVQKNNDSDDNSTNNINNNNVSNNNNNNHENTKDRTHHVSTLISDMSQDSSSSDTSSAENNYFVNTSRRIELPPSYLFPEGGQNNEKDVNIIMNLKNTIEQINVDTSSENEKSSPTSLSPDSENSEKMNEETQLNDDIKKSKKGNLKNNNNSVNNKRRVSFDPLALLLDASLEGELELVIRTAGQVKNPSAANDEGITALHNAICAGHFEIVRFLVQFGCDVNAQDSDGWTPLHCAASCNNLPMVRFLVEHGACIFATTLSDQETAAEKCEEDEEGFDGCSEFLYSVQEKLGILNTGAVYAVFDYEAHNPDELSFKEGDRLTVLRKGDEREREWWWSRHNDKEGYIPRNLLGLYPRTHPNTNRIQD